ncbi:Detected protein of unknown function [Hibiscus syriacus]|uniref:Uncharacterized protein n=1 Tax=Hibiscus syriacus TaxID=106335 RepID=A0A6A2ZUW9_HIBSY|nr:Detected protein of unknown function [Hibiscus syriacus]
MASFRVNICVILLVLILCQEIFVYTYVEGRHLVRSKACKDLCSGQIRGENSVKVPKMSGNFHGGSGSGQVRSSKVEYIEDVRPTAPGHSPGAGHSINN